MALVCAIWIFCHLHMWLNYGGPIIQPNLCGHLLCTLNMKVDWVCPLRLQTLLVGSAFVRSIPFAFHILMVFKVAMCGNMIIEASSL